MNKLYVNSKTGEVITVEAYFATVNLLKILRRLKIIKTKHIVEVMLNYQPIDFD